MVHFYLTRNKADRLGYKPEYFNHCPVNIHSPSSIFESIDQPFPTFWHQMCWDHSLPLAMVGSHMVFMYHEGPRLGKMLHVIIWARIPVEDQWVLVSGLSRSRKEIGTLFLTLSPPNPPLCHVLLVVPRLELDQLYRIKTAILSEKSFLPVEWEYSCSVQSESKAGVRKLWLSRSHWGLDIPYLWPYGLCSCKCCPVIIWRAKESHSSVDYR